MAKLYFDDGTDTELYLQENEDGSVTVGSEDWELITFNSDGTFTRNGGIGPNYVHESFCITKKGKIKESKVE